MKGAELDQWVASPLKRVVTVNARSLDENKDPGLSFRYIDIASVGRGILAVPPQPMTFGEAPSRARRLIQEGDVIVSTVRTYLRAVWPVVGATDDLVVSTGFAVMTPGPGLDSHFFGWWAQSDALIEEIAARSVGVSYPAVNAGDLGDVMLAAPSLAKQRAIADYLDAETTRIDALIASKRSMANLVVEREESALSHVFAPWARVPLRRVAHRIDVGIAEAATHAYADEGVPLIRSTNIRRNRLDVSDLLHIEPWFAERNRSKYLNAGDILTVRTGGTGVSAVVPPELHHSQCFTQLMTTLTSRQSPSLICAALNSGDAREYFERAGWGSAQANISVPLLAEAPIPEVPDAKQSVVLADVLHVLEVTERLHASLAEQIGMLAEHRRALVTATITGELEIPSAAA